MGDDRIMSAEEVVERIEEDSRASRRAFLGGSAAVVAATLLVPETAHATPASLVASPPPGFVPYSAPGRIIKVSKPGSLMPNGLFPKEDDAKAMLTRAMTELTGKTTLAEAAAQFVHPSDKVAVKVNGIALRNMSTNKELVLPFVDAMIESGVPPQNITLLEQYYGFFAGTRITEQNIPKGVKIVIHNNQDATMDLRMIPGTGVQTKFTRGLTESTAVINFSLIKDHGICGYTGCLKNMTHGNQIYPHYFHSHHASPQIALLYAQDIIKSRVRLHITDGFKLMGNGGPLWRDPSAVVPHEAVYVTTDPVAMDAIGADLVEKLRKDKGMQSLVAAGRAPTYIQAAADLGLGIADMSKIQLHEISI